jgi:hypothetical protein
LDEVAAHQADEILYPGVVENAWSIRKLMSNMASMWACRRDPFGIFSTIFHSGTE